MEHKHGPNQSIDCGCKEYALAEDSEDLYGSINQDLTFCLNEQSPGSGRSVLKAEENKFDKTKFVQSDFDSELLFCITFSSQVKLKSICLIALNDEEVPELVKIYLNSENIDFTIVEGPPIQEIQLCSNQNGKIEYPLKQSKFQSVNKLILYFNSTKNDPIGISYLGIKGFDTKMKQQIVKAVYESKAIPADHKEKADDLGTYFDLS